MSVAAATAKMKSNSVESHTVWNEMNKSIINSSRRIALNHGARQKLFFFFFVFLVNCCKQWSGMEQRTQRKFSAKWKRRNTKCSRTRDTGHRHPFNKCSIRFFTSLCRERRNEFWKRKKNRFDAQQTTTSTATDHVGTQTLNDEHAVRSNWSTSRFLFRFVSFNRYV